MRHRDAASEEKCTNWIYGVNTVRLYQYKCLNPGCVLQLHFETTDAKVALISLSNSSGRKTIRACPKISQSALKTVFDVSQSSP